ncbi:hypothetical protein C5167_021594 [Papaver somniferum]|nr:hypothetical protein C5167_021594 [Papaver somniferum]
MEKIEFRLHLECCRLSFRTCSIEEKVSELPRGEWVINSAGANFTPHVVHVNTEENVAGKIFAFSQKSPRAICILSANGVISNVTIRHPCTSGGSFEILSLCGSFSFVVEGVGLRTRTGGLSVSLAGADGRVIGGGVAGLLTAASPIQTICDERNI